MFFESLHDVWVMGGHGRYVWSAVGISVASCVWLALRELLAQRQCIWREQRRQQMTIAATVKE